MHPDRISSHSLPVLLTALIVLASIGGPVPARASSRLSAWAPSDTAVLRALVPGGVPELPYTLYRNAGPIQHTARLAALLVRGRQAIAAIAVESRPQAVQGIDPQGAWLLGIVADKGGLPAVVAESAMPRAATFAGSLRSVAISPATPVPADISVRFTTTLSGSGGASTSYLQIYSRQGRRLRAQFTLQTDSHITVSNCCTYGTAATLRLLKGGPVPQYGVQQWGYLRTAAGTQTYTLPGVIRYVPAGTGYVPDALILPQMRPVPVHRLPLVAALPAPQGITTLAASPTVAALPGGVTTLTAAASSLPVAQLFTGWTTGRLDLLVRTAAAWPAAARAARVGLYLQPDLQGALTHLVLSPRQAACRGGVGYGGTGWECRISVPAATAFGHATHSAFPQPSKGLQHRYTVAGVSGLALTLTAAGGGHTMAASLSPAANARDLSTVVLLWPSR
jgi:hypothetical protein